MVTRLELAESLQRYSERFMAAAVSEARRNGASWEEVAAAAGLTAAQAGSRWDETALRSLFPVQGSLHRPSAQQRLSDALAYLQVGAGVSVDEAAEQAGMDVAQVSQALEGGYLPSWPETYVLASVFGGSAEDLRVLWESARGTVSPPALPPQGAAGYLASALRGLHLSVGSPGLQRLSERALLPADCLDGVLSGSHTPPWPATARLVRTLAGRVEDFEPLWQAVEHASAALHGSASTGHLGCAGCLGPGPAAP
ncbi:hypothetical protein ACF1BB_27215 [Streptomyces griseoluteus]|uniref:hypothetical protein n=1 Tax=Streptomyces griseoluteus TaxID=29306 RepID=UPI0036FC970D